MTHKFVLLVNGQLQTYHSFEDIPDEFDHIIEFVPEVPEPPHTPEQHKAIDEWHEKLRELILKENKKYAGGDKNR